MRGGQEPHSGAYIPTVHLYDQELQSKVGEPLDGPEAGAGWNCCRLAGPLYEPDRCFLADELAELSDDDRMMDEASDQESVSLPVSVHVVFTLEQVWPLFDIVKAEEQPRSPGPVFQQEHEDQCYNLSPQ